MLLLLLLRPLLASTCCLRQCSAAGNGTELVLRAPNVTNRVEWWGSPDWHYIGFVQAPAAGYNISVNVTLDTDMLDSTNPEYLLIVRSCVGI